MFKENEQEPYDYIDEYSGIPVYDRIVETGILDKSRQLEFDFDTESCPAFGK